MNTEKGTSRALSREGGDGRVAEVMTREFQTASPNDMLEPLFLRMQAQRGLMVPVVHQGRLVGLVTLENIGEFLMIQSALETQARAAPATLRA